MASLETIKAAEATFRARQGIWVADLPGETGEQAVGCVVLGVNRSGAPQETAGGSSVSVQWGDRDEGWGVGGGQVEGRGWFFSVNTETTRRPEPWPSPCSRPQVSPSGALLRLSEVSTLTHSCPQEARATLSLPLGS